MLILVLIKSVPNRIQLVLGGHENRELLRRKRMVKNLQGEVAGNHGDPKNGPGLDDYGAQPTSVAEEMEFLRTFMTLNEAERILIGHNYTSFIKGCTFRGRDCFNET